MKRSALLVGLLILIAYSLPWIITPGASLTLNAYDLAEWTGLNPTIRNGTVPLLPTLALRLLPVLVVIWFGQITAWPRWLRLVVTLIIAFALLPPLEFFTSGLADPNFRQQFGLAVLTVIAGSLIYLPLTNRWHSYLRRIALVAVLLLSAAGLIVSANLLQSYQIPVQPGVGGMMLIGSVIIGVWREMRTNEVTSPQLPR